MLNLVTPRVGVWIETPPNVFSIIIFSVTPRVGVWIETNSVGAVQAQKRSHSPRGSVD